MAEDTRIPISESLKRRSMAAFESGKAELGSELAGRADEVFEDECLRQFERMMRAMESGRER
jgi:hypothetical protein